MIIGKEFPRLSEIVHEYSGDERNTCITFANFGSSRFGGLGYGLTLDAESCRKFAAYLLTVADKLEDSHGTVESVGKYAERAAPIPRPPSAA